MPRPRRLLTVLACAAGACALSAPVALAAAPAAPSSGKGVVLSLARHGVRLVDRSHRVGDVHLISTHGLHRGDVVSVRGGRAHVTRHLSRVSFLGRVVRSSGHGAVVQLGDGSSLSLGGGRPHGHRARSAATVTVNFQGLTAGETLLVTIATDDQGNVVLTIRVLSAPTDIGDGELHASGTITDDQGDGSFAIRTSDGRGLRFDDPQRLLEAANAGWCDIVDVTFHTSGDRRVADELQVTGQSNTGDCASDGTTDEVDGTVTAIAADASSLTVQPDDGSAATTIPVGDPRLLDGVSVGDDVAVTLGADGSAVDVEPLVNASDQGGGNGSSGGGDG